MTIKTSGLITTAIPNYQFDIDTDCLRTNSGVAQVWWRDVEIVADASGAPMDTPGGSGGFICEFHNLSRNIDARPYVELSLAQTAEIFHDLDHSVHLAGTVGLGGVLVALGSNRMMTEDSAIFTIEVEAFEDDGYEMLHEVTRRLIHHGIWESQKNVAPAGSVI